MIIVGSTCSIVTTIFGNYGVSVIAFAGKKKRKNEPSIAELVQYTIDMNEFIGVHDNKGV